VRLGLVMDGAAGVLGTKEHEEVFEWVATVERVVGHSQGFVELDLGVVEVVVIVLGGQLVEKVLESSRPIFLNNICQFTLL
jgi:hypothetical protein